MAEALRRESPTQDIQGVADRTGRYGAPCSSIRRKYIGAGVDRAGNVYAYRRQGIIFKIGADGRGAPFYQTKARRHSLEFDRERSLLEARNARPRLPDRLVGKR